MYATQSLKPKNFEKGLEEIVPQTVWNEKKQTAYLKVPEHGIVLFDGIHDKGQSKAVGILKETSVVQVDTVFYREIYRDFSKEWSLTFNVWYAVTINGKHYYTDYKIHDYIPYQKQIDSFQQKLFIVTQNTGYDAYYDVGYPEHFFVVVFNAKNQMVYESDILPFTYGYEFWEDDDSISTVITDQGFEFTIEGLTQKVTAVWTGKEVVVK